MTNSPMLMLFLTLLLASTACQRMPSTSPSAAKTHYQRVAESQQPVELNQTLAPLISPKDLQRNIEAADICILEIGKKKSDFDEGHVPGAQFVDWVADITDLSKADRYNIIDLPTMEKLLRRLGVKPDSRIVLYDRLNSRLSTRMYWTLKCYNHAEVQILDGGFEVWAASNQTSDIVKSVEVSDYKIEKQNEKIVADLDFIKGHLDDPKVQFVDGRPVAQFTGDEPGTVFHTGKQHKHRGHIPGAVNVFWKDNFKPDGTFKSKTDLQALYSRNGIKSDSCVVTYCNEGLHAAPPWFVLTEILGFGDVRVYDDSMSEWANSDIPIEKSDDPSK